MNKYEELLQATEPARNLLRAQYDPMCEIRITFDRVDVLRGEMGLPFEAARQEPGSIMRDAIFGSHPYKQLFGAVVRGLTAPRLTTAGRWSKGR